MNVVKNLDVATRQIENTINAKYKKAPLTFSAWIRMTQKQQFTYPDLKFIKLKDGYHTDTDYSIWVFKNSVDANTVFQNLKANLSYDKLTFDIEKVNDDERVAIYVF